MDSIMPCQLTSALKEWSEPVPFAVRLSLDF